MEEGEIVRVSLVDVVREGCEQVMEKLLVSLQAAAMYHLTAMEAGGGGEAKNTKGGGREVELAVGLQCALRRWCSLMLTPHIDKRWLALSKFLHTLSSSSCLPPPSLPPFLPPSLPPSLLPPSLLPPSSLPPSSLPPSSLPPSSLPPSSLPPYLPSCVWLQEMLCSVCVSISELEAAEAMATLLLHSQQSIVGPC